MSKNAKDAGKPRVNATFEQIVDTALDETPPKCSAPYSFRSRPPRFPCLSPDYQLTLPTAPSSADVSSSCTLVPLSPCDLVRNSACNGVILALSWVRLCH